MRHALVTGGAGFIGSHLVDRLLKSGWKVTVIDNFDDYYDPSIKRRNIAAHTNNKMFKLVESDIRNLESLKMALEDSYDVIVHLAAKAGVRPSVLNPKIYYEVNVLGTLNMLEIAKEFGIKQFIYASSSSVYGSNPNIPWREDETQPLPVSPYGASKLSGEALGSSYSQLYGIRFIALRFFTVYGPRQRPDLAIHKFTRAMLSGDNIEIYGSGEMARDYTFIEDIIDGVVSAINYEASNFEVFNLGNNKPISILELVETLKKVLGLEPRITFVDRQLGDVQITYADIEKARRLLNYNPQTELSVGVRKFVEWYQKNFNSVKH
jgi:UDP-glucuronate 4-epimerase